MRMQPNGNNSKRMTLNTVPAPEETVDVPVSEVPVSEVPVLEVIVDDCATLVLRITGTSRTTTNDDSPIVVDLDQPPTKNHKKILKITEVVRKQVLLRKKRSSIWSKSIEDLPWQPVNFIPFKWQQKIK
jgi:hypothetical protein